MKTGVLLPRGAFTMQNMGMLGAIVDYMEKPGSEPKTADHVFYHGIPILFNASLTGHTAHVHWMPAHIAKILRVFMAFQ